MAKAYLHAKFHLDPSNYLATVHQCHRQDRQRSDSIGRTVLQTVAQKIICYLAMRRLEQRLTVTAISICRQQLVMSCLRSAAATASLSDRRLPAGWQKSAMWQIVMFVNTMHFCITVCNICHHHHSLHGCCSLGDWQGIWLVKSCSDSPYNFHLVDFLIKEWGTLGISAGYVIRCTFVYMHMHVLM